MSHDKHRDDQLFNCGQSYELNYVAGRYAQRDKVLKFLQEKCAEKVIYHMTHREVYELIRKELGFELPGA